MEQTATYNDIVKFALQTRSYRSSVSSNANIRILKGDEGSILFVHQHMYWI